MSTQLSPRDALIHWSEGKCRKAMWSGFGSPAGLCEEPAFGTQLPDALLYEWRCIRREDVRSVYGHCCPMHGGPKADEPRVFRDGYDGEGRPMWCAVLPDFINLQESPAGFSANALTAVAELRKASA